MGLKNIFKMTKTDRYTQDGRDELAKLQETEDVKYKTGDISQKTGLQKQPDGSWAPPKNGAKAGKQSKPAEENKKTEYKLGDQLKLKTGKIVEFAGHTSNGKIRYTDKSGSTPITGAIEETEIDEVDNSSLSPREYAERMEESKPAGTEISPQDIARGLDELTTAKGGTKNIGGVKVTYVPGNGYRVTHKAPSGTELTTGYDSIEEAQQAVMFRLNRIKKGEIPAISEAAESKPAEGIPIQGTNWLSLPSGTRVTNEGAREKMARNNERIEAIKKIMEGRSAANNFRLGAELKSLQNENEWITSRLPPEKPVTQSSDSAPRELTGDCKIRIRK